MDRSHSSLRPSILCPRAHTQQRPAQPGPPIRKPARTHTAPRRPRVQPARLRFACCRQRRGRLCIHNPECRPTDRAGTQGKPGKALSPNCRGGSFPGRRQTAATPHAPPSEKAADIRTEPARARPPHSRERPTRLRPLCTLRMALKLGPATCPGSIPVLCRCLDRRLGLRWPAPAICPSAAASRSGEDARTDQGAQRTTDAPHCQRQHPAGPVAFYLPRAHNVE